MILIPLLNLVTKMLVHLKIFAPEHYNFLPFNWQNSTVSSFFSKLFRSELSMYVPITYFAAIIELIQCPMASKDFTFTTGFYPLCMHLLYWHPWQQNWSEGLAWLNFWKLHYISFMQSYSSQAEIWCCFIKKRPSLREVCRLQKRTQICHWTLT